MSHVCLVCVFRVYVLCVLCANQRNIHYSYNKWFRLKLSMMLIDSDKDNHTHRRIAEERERERDRLRIELQVGHKTCLQLNSCPRLSFVSLLDRKQCILKLAIILYAALLLLLLLLYINCDLVSWHVYAPKEEKMKE